jgi:hypothetical protein
VPRSLCITRNENFEPHQESPGRQRNPSRVAPGIAREPRGGTPDGSIGYLVGSTVISLLDGSLVAEPPAGIDLTYAPVRLGRFCLDGR